METVKALRQLRRTLRVVALILGISVSLAVPGGFGIVSYLDQANTTRFRAELAADRLAEFAYQQGPTWIYSDHRVPELIATLDPRNETRQTVLNDRGEPITSIGADLGMLTLSASAPITVGGPVLGTMRVEADLLPFLEQLLGFALIGGLLGLGVYLCVELFPLRALQGASHELAEVESKLRAEVTRTRQALDTVNHERIRAEEASRAKSEFVANMSHEFRTPLNAIIGFSDMLRSRMFGDLSDRYRGYAEDIHNSGLHLLDIVNDILDIAKIESGQTELARTDVDPFDIVEECLKVMADSAARASLRLTAEACPSTPRSVFVERVKIRQVLLNLLSNATKFTPPGGSVKVSLSADESDLLLTVADTGVGMTADEIELALQPFSQVAGAYTRGHLGTGLGLTIADALVRQHGGTLDIASRPGHGTTITVRVPLHPAATDKAAQADDAGPATVRGQ